MLTYRNATITDLPEIVRIYNSTVASRMVTADDLPVSVESKRNWFNVHTSTSRPLWVILDEQLQIVGWISFQDFYGRPAYQGTAEISIYLDAGHRGKGIGRQALQHAIEKAPLLGIKTLLGFIFSHNEQSIKLFRYFGFETWGNLPNIAELDGVERSLMIVGRRV